MPWPKLRDECATHECSNEGSKSEVVQRLVDCEREAGWPNFVPSSPTAARKKAAVKKQRSPKKTPGRTSSGGSPRQQAAEAGATDSASEGDPPESLAAVVKMAELTIEQLQIVVEKSDESAFIDVDADGRTPLHHLCERRWGVDLISTLVAKAPQAVTSTDSKGKHRWLACSPDQLQESASETKGARLTKNGVSTSGRYSPKKAPHCVLQRTTKQHALSQKVISGSGQAKVDRSSVK